MIDSFGFFNIRQGIFNDGQGLQSQEVHFKHTHAFDLVAVELGGKHIGLLGDT